jgi:Flp pilus assembly protein TadD
LRSLVLAVALLLPACAEPPTPAAPPTPSIASGPPPLPPADRSRLAALGTRLARECDTEALADLRALRERHGTVPELVTPLSQAYQSCNAPDALADLLAETLPDHASRSEIHRLAAAYIRAARYQDAATVLGPLAQTDPNDVQTLWLTGFSLYHAGKPTEALPLLTAGRTKGSAADAGLLIGLATLDGGDVPGALLELESAAAAAPNNPSVHHALTRAYMTAGRTADATASANRTRELHAALAEAEARGHRLSTLGTALNEAWNSDRLDEAEEIINSMWTEAPPDLRQKLLGFRVELYRRTGRTVEETEARAQLEPTETRP